MSNKQQWSSTVINNYYNYPFISLVYLYDEIVFCKNKITSLVCMKIWKFGIEKAALPIMPSHQQNTHVFADGCKNMNDIFNNYVCSASHMRPGPWFNIKMPSYRYRKSHCGDKTILRPSYLHNGISYTGKTTSLYWIRALDSIFKMSGASPGKGNTMRI